MPFMWQHLPEPPSIKLTYCTCPCTDYTACRLRSNDPCENCQFLASVCSSHLYSMNEALVVFCLLCGNTFWSRRPSSKHVASVHELTTIRLNPSISIIDMVKVLSRRDPRLFRQMSMTNFKSPKMCQKKAG